MRIAIITLFGLAVALQAGTVGEADREATSVGSENLCKHIWKKLV